MNIKKNITVLFSVAAAMAAVGSASAQSVEFTSLNGNDGTFTYTSGAGGGLALGSPFAATLDYPTTSIQTNNPALVTFTGLQNVGTTVTGTVGPNTLFDQQLSGGMFTIKDASGTHTLLSGSFTGADLSGTLGTNQAGVTTNFFNVAYTGGDYATAAGIQLGAQALNKFNFSLINTIPNPPGLSVTGSYLDGFTSAGNGQFTGVRTAVPEPATVVPFMLGGLGLFGLIVRKTRQSSSATA